MLSRFTCAGAFGILIAAMAAHAEAPVTDSAWRASSRLGYGPTERMVADIAAQGGARSWAARQIEAAHAAAAQPARIPAELGYFSLPLEKVFESFRAEREARKAAKDAGQPGKGGAANMEGEQFSRDATRDAAAWRVLACSDPSVENPLLARMTEFWFNHLNVFVGKGAVRPFVGHYVVHAIRPHALGKFEDLLLASSRHPAMLFYLDQAQSVADGTTGPLGRSRGLNENYARELLELHTVGVNGGYTQTDVRELARILTGWTVAPNDPSGFRFAERMHDRGEKRLLGVSFMNNGVAEGERAIRMLARDPATARRIANRLATFFVADQPPQALIERLAKSFSATQGDIRSVLRTMVESPEFWQPGQTLFKTPFDYACSSLSALGGARDRRDYALTLSFLANAGQPVHGWQTPDGYKTDAATWMAPEALTRRADFAIALGRQAAEPRFMEAFLSPDTRARISREPPQLRTGLMLASPDFMRK